MVSSVSELSVVEELRDDETVITNPIDEEIELPQQTELENESTLHLDEDTKDNLKELDEEQSPSKAKKSKLSPKKTRPSYLDADECYHLFSSIYFDRHSVSKLLATVIKELKKQRSSMPLQLITAILYLSNLKVNPKIRPTASAGSLYDKSIVYDNQENHVLPFSAFMRHTRGKGPSISFTRFEKLWSGIGLNYLDLPSETLDDLLNFLTELTAYNHRNLRFIATASLLSFMIGLAELESEKRSALEIEKGKKKKGVERELERIGELKDQLYLSVICHRIRDVFTPIRELVTRDIEGHCIQACPEVYCVDDYLKYIGVALSDKDASVRIEGVSQLITLTKRDLTSDLKELLERHKNRILFMTRDTNETVILSTIDLVDCMKENDMISSQEDELVYELILDISQSIGHRAFEYYARWSLKNEKNRFVSLLQYLDQYAKDDTEIHHVYVFVLNAAGDVDDLMVEPYRWLFDCDSIHQSLLQQRKEYKLDSRSIQLLASLVKDCLRVLKDGINHGLSKRQSLYEKMSSIMEGILPQLFSMYKTETPILKLLVDCVSFIQFSSVEMARAVASNLLSLFESETDLDAGNHILNVTTHIVASCAHSEDLDLISLLRECTDRTISQWKIVNQEKAPLILLQQEQESSVHELCLVYSRLVNVYCYQDITEFLIKQKIFESIDLLLNDLPTDTENDAILELRYLGFRIQQIYLLYRLLHSQHNTDPTQNSIDPSPSDSYADVQASIQLFVEAISAEITRLLSRESVLLHRYELLLCDLLIPAGDDVITEDLTRLIGDLVRIQLLGYHDADLLIDGVVPEEGSTRQQIATKQVLTPLYQCSLAHAASVLPSALLFFICDYGDVATQLGRDLLRQVKNSDVKYLAKLVQDSLQFSFSVYKTKRVLVKNTDAEPELRYLHFVNVSRRISMLLGVQLQYSVLVPMFEMMKEAIGTVANTHQSGMIEFLEALLPFSSKLTQEARDLLSDELDRSVGLFDEESREILEAVISKQDANESVGEVPPYARVFAAFRSSLKVKAVKNEKRQREREVKQIEAIQPSKKRDVEKKTKRNKKTENQEKVVSEKTKKTNEKVGKKTSSAVTKGVDTKRTRVKSTGKTKRANK